MEGSAENLQIFSQFQRLLAEGPAVGVHFVVTADRSLAVPASLASAFGRRLVLRLSTRTSTARWACHLTS